MHDFDNERSTRPEVESQRRGPEAVWVRVGKPRGPGRSVVGSPVPLFARRVAEDERVSLDAKRRGVLTTAEVEGQPAAGDRVSTGLVDERDAEEQPAVPGEDDGHHVPGPDFG